MRRGAALRSPAFVRSLAERTMVIAAVSMVLACTLGIGPFAGADAVVAPDAAQIAALGR